MVFYLDLVHIAPAAARAYQLPICSLWPQRLNRPQLEAQVFDTKSTQGLAAKASDPTNQRSRDQIHEFVAACVVACSLARAQLSSVFQVLGFSSSIGPNVYTSKASSRVLKPFVDTQSMNSRQACGSSS